MSVWGQAWEGTHKSRRSLQTPPHHHRHSLKQEGQVGEGNGKAARRKGKGSQTQVGHTM